MHVHEKEVDGPKQKKKIKEKKRRKRWMQHVHEKIKWTDACMSMKKKWTDPKKKKKKKKKKATDVACP